MEKYKIINDNTLNKLIIEKESIDLTVTSPPYNVGVDYNSNDDLVHYNDYIKFTKQWLENVYFWTKDTGRLCLNIPLDKNKGGQKSIGADITTIAKKVGWQYHSTIIWNEGNISRRTAWGSFCSASAPYVIAPVELILILYKNEWKRKRIGHPAPFPRELPRRCIKLLSFVNDMVLDPFLGSGTTMIEVVNNKRKYIGIELDKEYKELAEKRIRNECLNNLFAV